MGKINVVLANGKVVSVDEETYLAARGREGAGEAEDPFDAVRREEREVRRKANGGVIGAAEATLLSAADTASAGILGKAVKAISPEAGQHMQESMQDHPVGTFVGSAIGVLGPGVGSVAGAIGGKVAAKTGSKIAGMVAEGGFIGAGSHVARTNITGDQVSIEGMAEDIGLGGAIAGGLGLMAKGVRWAGKPGATKLPAGDMNWEAVKSGVGEMKFPMAEAKAAREKAITARAKADGITEVEKVIEKRPSGEKFAATERADAAADKAVLKASKERAQSEAKAAAEELKATAQTVDETPSWGATRDAHNDYRNTIQQANAKLEKEAAAYEGFASENGVKAVNREYEKAQNELRAKLGKLKKTGQDPPELHQALFELQKVRNTAREAAAAGDFDAAARAYDNAKPVMDEWLPDFTAPSIPKRPLGGGQLMEVPPGATEEADGLGQKAPPSIAKIAADLDGATQGQIAQLANDLGVGTGETAAETLEVIRQRLHDTFNAPGQKLAATEAEHIPFRKFDEVAEEIPAAVPPPIPKGPPAGTLPEEWEALSAEAKAARNGTRENPNTVWNAETKAWEVADNGMPTGEPAYQEARFTNAKGLAKGPRKGLVSKALGFAVDAASFSAARMADMGGGLGVVTRLAAGRGVRSVLEGVEATVGGAAVAGKAGIRSKISQAIGRYAEPVAGTLETLGPVGAALGHSFPSGAEDPSTDPRDQMKNRLTDLRVATADAPEALYHLAKEMMGSSGDVAYKLTQHFMQGLNYLNQTAPKDPGVDITMTGSRWSPTYQEVEEFSHRWEATLYPAPYLARVLAGDGSMAGMEALETNWPAMVTEARNEALMRDWKSLNLKSHEGLSMLFKQPMSAMQDPDVFFILQGNPIPQAAQMAQQQDAGPTAGGKPGFGKPGRPAAYDSSIAGSSPGKLISQGQ